MTKTDKNHYLKCKCQGNHHFKHSLWLNLAKIITLNANAQEIVTNLTKIVTLNANAQKIFTLNTVYDQN